MVGDEYKELSAELEEDVRARLEREGFDHEGDYDLYLQWAKYCGIDPERHVQDFIEAYEGEYHSKDEWAEEFFTDCYKTEIENLPYPLQYAIDWQVVARDCETAGDYYFLDLEYGVAVFRNI